MKIRLRTLGGLTVLVDGNERPEMRGRPVRLAVLIYLALEREASRDRIMAVLWPESDQEHARQALRQTLYALRQDLGDGWLESDHDALRATASLQADATDMLEAIDQGQHRRVADLYGGGFLEGFHLAESQPFQLWCDQWRARLERLNRKARRGLIDDAVGGGDLDGALAEARRWLDSDPLEDEAQHRVIELLFRLGRGEDALRQYETYSSLLAREDLEPLDETRALVDEIRRSSHSLPGLPATPGNALANAPAIPKEIGPTAKRRAVHPVRVGMVAAVLVGLVGAVVLVRDRRSEGSTLDPERVMVLPLTNETGDSTMHDMGLLAAEWITHGVAHMGTLEAVPTLDVLQMLDAGLGGQAAARQRHAGTLVSGRLFRTGNSLELRVQITDLGHGRLWDDLDPVRVTPDRPEAGLSELTERVTGSLAVRFIPGTPLPRPSVLRPPGYAAFRAILDASEFVRRGDWAGSLPHLERAVALDSTFYRARLFVASALYNLGEYARADSVLDALEPSRDGFSDYERVVFQTGEAMLRGNRAAELASVREGARLDPGGTLHYIAPAVALAAGRPKAALDFYEGLDPNCPWAPDFLAVWASGTGALHLLGRHRDELKEARKGRKQHPNRIPTLFFELRALSALGRQSEVVQNLTRATTMAPEPGWNAGALYFLTSLELRDHGHPEAANAVLDSTLAWYRARPADEKSTVLYRLGYADALFTAGDLEEAGTVIESLRQQLPEDLDFLGREAVLTARLGQQSRLREAVDSLDSREGPYTFGAVPYWLGVIAAWSGQEQEALRLLRRSFAEGHPRGIILHEDPYLEPLRDLPAFANAVSDDH